MSPQTDPTPIIEHFRGDHATEILAAAVSYFDLFDRLGAGPLALDELAHELGIERRPAVVLVTALRAMGLLTRHASGRLDLTAVAREHLLPGGPFYIGDYLGLASDSAGVLDMVERLRTNKPSGARPDEGAAYIFKEGMDSAMESEATARRLTLALAGRARNVAPVLAERLPLPGARRLLDVGGGTGIYSVELLRKNPDLRAVVWDRPEVLKVARELAADSGVAGRLEFVPGNMFADEPPGPCDTILLSNVLHDWDEPECQSIVARCAAALAPGGRLLVHDVFLNDELDGPLPIALYSAALFSLTEGRAYSGAEYRAMLAKAGLRPEPIVPTLIHCSVLPARKPA